MQRAVMEAANAELNLMRNRNQFFSLESGFSELKRIIEGSATLTEAQHGGTET